MAAFYLDNDVALAIAGHLRHLGHTATTAREQGASHADDDEQLLLAATHDWILVSHNFNDFKLLHSAWRRWSNAWGVSADHSGILIIPQARWSDEESARQLERITTSADDSLNSQLYRWMPETGWHEVH